MELEAKPRHLRRNGCSMVLSLRTQVHIMVETWLSDSCSYRYGRIPAGCMPLQRQMSSRNHRTLYPRSGCRRSQHDPRDHWYRPLIWCLHLHTRLKEKLKTKLIVGEKIKKILKLTSTSHFNILAVGASVATNGGPSTEEERSLVANTPQVCQHNGSSSLVVGGGSESSTYTKEKREKGYKCFMAIHQNRIFYIEL